MDPPVTTIGLAPGAEVLAALERARDTSTHAVLFDATHPPADVPPWSEGQLTRVVLCEVPTVFAFEGPLRGPLTDLALAADIRICSADASLQGRLAGNARVRSLTDEATALALFLGRAVVGSEELLNAGLVSAVTAPGQAHAEAQRIASVIASRGPIATRLGKEAIWRGLGQPFEQALRFETDLTLLLQTTKDRAEGVRAFLEKRPPNFTGE